MPVLSARNIHKAYGSRKLLDGADLTVRTGERVGVLGVNGAGKSTFLRILAGVEPADEGVVDRRRDKEILYLPQEPELDPDLSPRAIVGEGLREWQTAVEHYEDVSKRIEGATGDAADELVHEQAKLAEAIERLGGWTRAHLVEEMLALLGVTDIDRAVGTMSGGERRRVALARLLVAAPACAILDEPTNHLDADTIEWLEQYLVETFKGAVLIVTHDRYVLDAIADRIVELDDGKLTEFSGGYADYLDQKAILIEHAGRAESNRLNLLRREREWLSRGPKARTTKQKARIQRAEAVMAVEAPRDAARVGLEGLESGASRTGKTILDLIDVGLELGGKRLLADFTLRMVSGDRCGIVGPNGAGKTSLLRIARGDLPASDGEVKRGVQTKISYFDQARAELVDEWSVFDNVVGREGAERTGGGMVKIGERSIEMRSYLDQFLFDVPKQRQKVGALSGGERARVALAKALKEGANLLLLDEPTNDLDIMTLGALEELLVAWPGCVLVVSHDRYFLNRVATSILAFEGDGKVVRYPGGYDSYRSLRPDPARDAKQARASTPPKAGNASSLPKPSKASTPPPKPSKASTPPPPRKPGAGTRTSEKAARPAVATLTALNYAERNELDGILDVIDDAELRVSALEASLADPRLYTERTDEAKRIQDDHDGAAREVARLTARWEDLEARRHLKK
jgi:ABC transport system ATP-binding/permease protein